MLWLATIAIFPPPSAGVSQTLTMHEWQTLQATLRADNVQVIVSDDEIRRIRMRKSDISRDHGFLDIDWTQREEAEVELLQLSQDTHVVINVKARRLLKAPLGTCTSQAKECQPSVKTEHGESSRTTIQTRTRC